ncbi:MAG TPA: filamentous hemagglutinin N-terminal domain-containing protein, partial [Rubrivivax sp.]|nr:filamentous hemagglutinin N-terminal domain-containing protein [Rubrivivax sp.]
MMNVLHPRSSVWRRAPRASWPGRPAAQLALVRALAAAGLASFALVGADARAQSPALPALPTGLAVVQGQARVAVQGKQMTVTNSAGALLDWQSFSIGAGHGVRFEQPSAASRVLNRVVGRDPSQILGSLTSNGQVWLVNPYGVLFGRDARVDVGSLVVSTLNIGNDDWRAGRLGLAAAAGDRDAALVNQGELRTTAGGRVLLLGGSGGVRNEGLIVAPDGQVALAAGASVELVDSATPNVAVRVQAPRGEVLNLGSVSVGGGRVDLTAAMVNQQGLVRADAVAGSGGHIELRAAGRTTLGAGSLTSATGSRGGDVRVLGTEVALLDDSTIDVSGSQGGGSVLAGGGRQGRDASVPNARALYMGGRASIHADANGRGDGGSIVLWSDEATRVYGSLSARGGAGGGNGGFIETSGGHLDARPASVRADAPAGAAGQWLLDPNDILITDDANTVDMTAGPSFTSLDDSAVISSSTIEAALNDGNNVVVTTGHGGANSQPGDITVRSANIRVASKRRVSLTLAAERDIVVQNSSIIGAAGEQEVDLDVTLN